jgi:FtsZ-interacting cell division protein YlmF
MAGIHNNYLTELVLKQKGNRVDGIFSYYFRDKYQSFFVHGRYNPKTREVIIQNIPVIYFNSNSTVNSIDCNTNFIAVIINSKVKSSLKGAFYHDERYKYMCPDLKVNYTLDRSDRKQDSVLEAGPTDTKVWKPQADDYVVDVAKTDQSIAAAGLPEKDAHPATEKSPVPTSPPPADSAKEIAAVKPTIAIPDSSKSMAAADSTKMTPDDSAAVAIVKPADKEDSKKIAESFIARKSVLNQVLEVESDSVRLSFYDNGEIDGDSISVFVNKRVVLTHQMLAAKALTMYLRLDSTLNDTEISMFAENLGKFPPNTALMVITDGKHRYEVFMSSSLTENSTIQLRRKKKS